MNTRRVARELALLTLSQLRTADTETPPSLADLLGRAAALLAQEAHEHLQHAEAALKQVRDGLQRISGGEYGPELVHEVIRGAVNARQGDRLDEVALDKAAERFWRRAKDESTMPELTEGLVDTLVPEALNGLDEAQAALDLIHAALEWPAMAALADSEGVRGFALQLIGRYRDHAETIDKALGEAAANWKVERMASIDRDVLRIALGELLYDPGVPVEVAINEAVELAKKYGTDESGKFVNGVLSAFARDAAKLRS